MISQLHVRTDGSMSPGVATSTATDSIDVHRVRQTDLDHPAGQAGNHSLIATFGKADR